MDWIEFQKCPEKSDSDCTLIADNKHLVIAQHEMFIYVQKRKSQAISEYSM